MRKVFKFVQENRLVVEEEEVDLGEDVAEAEAEEEGQVEEGRTLKTVLANEPGKTRIRQAVEIIIGKEDTIKKWHALAQVRQREAFFCESSVVAKML